jgi:hypothetical protein
LNFLWCGECDRGRRYVRTGWRSGMESRIFGSRCDWCCWGRREGKRGFGRESVVDMECGVIAKLFVDGKKTRYEIAHAHS